MFKTVIQLGMANSVGNLSQVGVKTGLLVRGEIFEKAPVIKEEYDNGTYMVK